LSDLLGREPFERVRIRDVEDPGVAHLPFRLANP
jgi:hypothetical protein